MLHKSLRNLRTNTFQHLCQVARFSSSAKDQVHLNSKWLDLAIKEQKGKINIKQQLVRETNEQMLLKPIYTSEDWSPPKNPEISGEYPYKRGHMATMYTFKPWTVRQYAGFSTVEESNKFYKENLKAG